MTIPYNDWLCFDWKDVNYHPCILSNLKMGKLFCWLYQFVMMPTFLGRDYLGLVKVMVTNTCDSKETSKLDKAIALLFGMSNV